MLKKEQSELVYKYLYLKKTQAIEEIMKNSGIDPIQIEYDDKLCEISSFMLFKDFKKMKPELEKLFTELTYEEVNLQSYIVA